jgi:hypothetical protein
MGGDFPEKMFSADDLWGDCGRNEFISKYRKDQIL